MGFFQANGLEHGLRCPKEWRGSCRARIGGARGNFSVNVDEAVVLSPEFVRVIVQRSGTVLDEARSHRLRRECKMVVGRRREESVEVILPMVVHRPQAVSSEG